MADLHDRCKSCIQEVRHAEERLEKVHLEHESSLQERFEKELAEKEKQREKEVKELQDLLEQERTAAKHAKLDYEEKAQQLEEAERMQLEFNEQKEEQQQEHAKQLAQHAKLQEELQEQEKHSEFVTKELEQQKSSWQQRNEEQLQELRELQSKMNSLKDAEAGEGINDKKYMYISCIYYICMILYVHGKYTASFLTSHRSPGHGSSRFGRTPAVKSTATRGTVSLKFDKTRHIQHAQVSMCCRI